MADINSTEGFSLTQQANRADIHEQAIERSDPDLMVDLRRLEMAMHPAGTGLA